MSVSRETVQRLTAVRPPREERASTLPAVDTVLRPLGVGELLDRAAEVLRRRFLALFLPAFVLWLPAQAVQLLAAAGRPGETLANEELLILFLIFGLNYATSMLVSGAAALITYRSVQGAEIGMRAAIVRFITRLPVLFVVNVVSVLAVMAGIFTCGVASLFFAWKFLIVQVIAVLEPVSPGVALARSWVLVRGGLVRWLGIFVTAFAITLPFMYVSGTFGEGQAQDALARQLPIASEGFIDLLSIVIASALSALSSAFYGVVITLFYVDCRVRREALDLFTALPRPSPSKARAVPAEGAA